MDRGAWPFFVDGVTCLVISVSVCEEKREERREDQGIKGDFFFKKKMFPRPSTPPDELAQNVSEKKKPFRTNYSSIFLQKFRIWPFFSFIYMIRIRFFWARRINSEIFSGGTIFGRGQSLRQGQQDGADHKPPSRAQRVDA